MCNLQIFTFSPTPTLSFAASFAPDRPGEFQFIAAFAYEEFTPYTRDIAIPLFSDASSWGAGQAIYGVSLNCVPWHRTSLKSRFSFVEKKLFLGVRCVADYVLCRRLIYCQFVKSPVVTGDRGVVFRLNLDFNQGSILSLQREHFWNRLPHAATRFLGVIPQLSAAG